MTRDGFDHRASLSVRYASERRARLVADAVAVEQGEIDDARSSARIDRDGRELSVDVLAADLVALRAGLNTWRGLVEVAERVCDVGGE
ncbi:MAG: KEOPS complex subunit Pcc1 [Haloferacaceae archaeon]